MKKLLVSVICIALTSLLLSCSKSNEEPAPEPDLEVKVFRDYDLTKKIEKDNTISVDLFSTTFFFVDGFYYEPRWLSVVCFEDCIKIQPEPDEYYDDLDNCYSITPLKVGEATVFVIDNTDPDNPTWFHVNVRPVTYEYETLFRNVLTTVIVENEAVKETILADLTERYRLHDEYSTCLATFNLVLHYESVDYPRAGEMKLKFTNYLQPRTVVTYEGIYVETWDDENERSIADLVWDEGGMTVELEKRQGINYYLTMDLTPEYRQKYPDEEIGEVRMRFEAVKQLY